MIDSQKNDRPRAADLGLAPGTLPPGPLNAITDVPGVLVGQVSLMDGADVRTGVTAILPHNGDLYRDKVPAGLAVGNGFGKLAGGLQVMELGELETPIVLTNTLAVPEACRAVIDHTLARSEGGEIRSINPLVGETNDGRLNDITKPSVRPDHIRAAIDKARSGPVAEGCVGAGCGTIALGWKAGIGTASRRVGRYTVGVLVQSNFDGALELAGRAVEPLLGRSYTSPDREDAEGLGSVMVIVATDAPLSGRNLRRLADRALAGPIKAGSGMTNGSGDFGLAFSSHPDRRLTPERRGRVSLLPELPNELMTPLFKAAIEAGLEAVLNSLFRAGTVTGAGGLTVEAIPIEALRKLTI